MASSHFMPIYGYTGENGETVVPTTVLVPLDSLRSYIGPGGIRYVEVFNYFPVGTAQQVQSPERDSPGPEGENPGPGGEKEKPGGSDSGFSKKDAPEDSTKDPSSAPVECSNVEDPERTERPTLSSTSQPGPERTSRGKETVSWELMIERLEFLTAAASGLIRKQGDCLHPGDAGGQSEGANKPGAGKTSSVWRSDPIGAQERLRTLVKKFEDLGAQKSPLCPWIIRHMVELRVAHFLYRFAKKERQRTALREATRRSYRGQSSTCGTMVEQNNGPTTAQMSVTQSLDTITSAKYNRKDGLSRDRRTLLELFYMAREEFAIRNLIQARQSPLLPQGDRLHFMNGRSFNDGLSPFFAQDLCWTPRYSDPQSLPEESRVLWPSSAKFADNGANRARKGLGRCFPLPRENRLADRIDPSQAVYNDDATLSANVCQVQLGRLYLTSLQQFPEAPRQASCEDDCGDIIPTELPDILQLFFQRINKYDPFTFLDDEAATNRLRAEAREHLMNEGNTV